MRPQTAAEWLDQADSFYQYEASTTQIAEAYAAYVISFVPDDVEKAIENEYPIYPNCGIVPIIEDLRKAARYGASLAGRMEAVRFAEWIREKNYRPSESYVGYWFNVVGSETTRHTTEQLYEIFKKESNG